MFGLLLYLACVGIGTGVQIRDAVKENKNRKAKGSGLTPKRNNYESASSESSESSGYTPILDNPDFYMTFGGY